MMTDPCHSIPADSTIVLPPLFCGGIDHYALIRAAGGNTRADWQMRFEKRFKDTHRFAIADTRGRLELTVPIAKPSDWHCSWADILLSDHGHWWDVHRIALESAYGRTPFFEFYIDSLLPMLTEGVCDRYVSLRTLSDAWDSWIRSRLLLSHPLQASAPTAILPATSLPEPEPYWQVRADKLGFIPRLSILDLIFNLGPEAAIYIDRRAEMITL
ncbi:MAG: WbqC family protein [Staphylococcus sp.]|nr:WbqC family protein [Staphylococcus sp.]